MKCEMMLLVALAFCAVQAQGPGVIDHSTGYMTTTSRIPSSPGNGLPSDSLNCRLVGTLTVPGARHVVVDGNYAYLAVGWQGFRVVDISNKAAPVVVGSLYVPDPDTFVYNVAKCGNYCYLLTGRIIVVDVSDPTNPTIVRRVYTTGFTYGMAIVGNRAYVAHWTNDFAVMGLDDPSYPDWFGECYPPFLTVWTAAQPGDNYVYASLYDSGMCVIDVSDSSNPTVVGRYDTIFETSKCERLIVDGDYVYLNESSRLVILDVSNPTAPVKVGLFQGVCYSLSVSKAGDYLYVGYADNGVRVLDVSDPTNPTEVGYYQDANGMKYVLAHGGYIYTTSSDTTFNIIEFYGGASVVGESRWPPAGSSQMTATIVRGVLLLTGDGRRDTGDPAALLDPSGRRVMELQPGPNDVQHLSPGVYFVRSPESVDKVLLAQ